MEGKRRREGLLEKTAQAMDLPLEVVPGLPKVFLTGDREVRVEEHGGILAYGEEEIHVGSGKLTIRIWGEKLRLRVMTQKELLITGGIRGVELI